MNKTNVFKTIYDYDYINAQPEGTKKSTLGFILIQRQ